MDTDIPHAPIENVRDTVTILGSIGLATIKRALLSIPPAVSPATRPRKGPVS